MGIEALVDVRDIGMNVCDIGMGIRDFALDVRQVPFHGRHALAEIPGIVPYRSHVGTAYAKNFFDDIQCVNISHCPTFRFGWTILFAS